MSKPQERNMSSQVKCLEHLPQDQCIQNLFQLSEESCLYLMCQAGNDTEQPNKCFDLLTLVCTVTNRYVDQGSH